MLFLEYPKCSTCQKAKKWLDDHGIAYEDRHIKEQNPSAEELKAWHEKSGFPLKKFFNTSGMLYKEMQLKDKLPQMSEEEQYALLATDGMLVKRPVLVGDGFVLTGFKESTWAEALGIKERRRKFVGIAEMLDELKQKAHNDSALREELLATRKEAQPYAAFCKKCRELGYEIYEMDLITAGEEAYAAMRRSTNGGGENSPMLEGEDDYYELFFAGL